MNEYQITSTKSNNPLFEGIFPNFTLCLEAAVEARTHLAHANLREKDLSGANLDDAILPGADFTGSNLSGVNLSEAALNAAIFQNTALYNTCFAYSSLTACDFTGASFGATDVSGAVLNAVQLSTLSAFTLDFGTVKTMQGCIFINADGRITELSRPPIVINGATPHPIILCENIVHLGHNRISKDDFMALCQKIYTEIFDQPVKNLTTQSQV